MSKKTLWWIIFVLGGLFAAGIFVIIFGGAPEAPPVAQTVATGSGDLRLSAQIASSWVVRGDAIEFWLQVENTGKAALSNVTLLPLDAPEFAVESHGCQSPGGACPVNTSVAVANAPPSSGNTSATHPPAAAASPSADLLTNSLASGQKITVWIHLRAVETHPNEILSAGVAWTDSTSHQSSLAVPLGPVGVRTFLDEWIQARVGLLQGLALPLATFLLGVVFSVAKYYADRADKAADEERAHAAQIADANRAQLTQTWNQMLPASHKLALGFYMPLSSALHELLSRMISASKPKQSNAAPAADSPSGASAATASPATTVNAIGTAPAATDSSAGGDSEDPPLPPIEKWDDQDLHRAFYGLVLFESRIRKMNVRVGGFYFKSRGGEKIARQCYARYGQSFYRSAKDVQELMERVRDHVNPEADLGDFNAAWRKKQNLFDEFWKLFRAWAVKLDGYRAAVPFLDAFQTVLDYEANRPYEYWYGSRKPLEIDAKVEGALRKCEWLNIADENERKQFRDVVSEYLDENKKPNPPAAPASKKP